MSAAHLVGGEECGAAGARCGDQGRALAGDGAADWTGASNETGILPEPGFKDIVGEARSAVGVPESAGTGAEKEIPRLGAVTAKYGDGPGKIFWTDLCARRAEAGSIGVRGTGSESAGTAIVD